MGEYLPVLRERVRAPRFNSLFLFVTSRCNSLCRTCFYFDQLNSPDDLSFDEIRRISETAPRFRKLWISGGEPFLREGLAEIIGVFARNNGIRNVNLPTNGLLGERIFREVGEIRRLAPETSIDLNFSLDGLANTHDVIRGVPNNFGRTVETLKEAAERWRGDKRLRVNVATVITRTNYREILQLGLKLAEEARVDGHYFEVVRGETPDAGMKGLSESEVRELHSRLMPLHRMYARRLFAHLAAPMRALASMYYLGNIRLHFDLHEKCLSRPSKWPMQCTAGQTSLVIDHNGAFRACELRPRVGRMQDFGLDTGAVLRSAALGDEVARIPEANCWCTHSCFIQDSSKFSARVQLFEIPWAWLRQRKDGLQNAPLEEIERFRALELA